MPIVNVDLSNSLEFFRTTTNQCILALNYITSNAYITTGTVRVNPTAPVTGLVSLNVANGIISGNGARIFSIPFSGISGQFTNSQLQNTIITINSGTGISSNGFTILGGKAVLLVTSNIVDSKNDTSTSFAASANAVKSLLDPVSVIQKTNGVFAPNVGGTGITSYSNGQILLTNNNSLTANTIRSNTGIVVTNEPGSITLTANIIQGENVTVTYLGSNGAISFTQNAPPIGTTSTAGVIQLIDSITSTSTTLGATANAVNATSNFLSTRAALQNPSAINAYGRLIDVRTYTNSSNGAGNTFIWTRPVGWETDFAFAIITAVAPGGGSASANNGVVPGTITAPPAIASIGGGAGASIQAIITAEDLRLFGDDNAANTLTIKIGQIGRRGEIGGASPGNIGTNGGNVTIGVRGGAGDPPPAYLYHLEGGKAGPVNKIVSFTGDANTTTGLSRSFSGIARAFANSTYGTLIMKSSGMHGYPGLVFRTGTNATTHYEGKMVVGGQGAAPVYPYAIGDAYFQTSDRYGTPSRFIDDHSGPTSPTIQLPVGQQLQSSSNVANMQGRIAYGVGGEGPYNVFDGNTVNGGTRDVPGANGGFAYVKIESYVNV